MNYLITGASGFVGGHLVEAVLKEDSESQITVIDLKEPDYYCPHRGLGEKPSPSGEDFSMLAVWNTTGNRAIPYTI